HTQERINALLVEHVKAGKRVCRLKGGDGFVFGRGGEELDALDAHGLPYQVVPGVTAATACAAYAGIPLTDRAHSHGVVLTTAYPADPEREPDWHTLTRSGHTLAFYMGAKRLAHVAEKLMAAGLPAATPFAVVERGATPAQRVLSGRLDEVDALTDVSAPAMLFVGRAAAAAGAHRWYQPERFATAGAGVQPLSESLALGNA
ncbi:MAG: SAM-dependent methyltransferase, partial [Pseudomonadota bacterium]